MLEPLDELLWRDWKGTEITPIYGPDQEGFCIDEPRETPFRILRLRASD